MTGRLYIWNSRNREGAFGAGAGPAERIHLTPQGGPSKLRLGGALDLFHHTTTVTAVTDTNPRLRDNRDLIGVARGNPLHQDGPRSCTKRILSALENRNGKQSALRRPKSLFRITLI